MAISREVDITVIVQSGGIVRTDLDLQDFIDLFSQQYRPEMVANREKRWRNMLTAARGGTLLSKPTFQSPYKYSGQLLYEIMAPNGSVKVHLDTKNRFGRSAAVKRSIYICNR